MNDISRLPWQWLKADSKTSGFALLVAALFTAVFLVASLAGFTERLQVMLLGKSQEFLAADRVLRSSEKISEDWLAYFKSKNLKQAETLSFQSMLYAGDQLLLVSVKAATNNYPLKGQLQYRDNKSQAVKETQQGPKPGEVWLDQKAMQSLQVNIGDSVELGEARLQLSKVLVSEPDRGFAAFSMGPKILMAMGDVAKTQVVQPGSRVTYRYLFAANKSVLSELEAWLKPKLTDQHKWLDINNAQPTVAKSLQRAQQFFYLACSVILLLASIAVALASFEYLKQHQSHIALLKTLGAKRKNILTLLLFMLLAIYTAVFVVAATLGFTLQQLAINYVANLQQLPMPELLWWPLLLALGISLLSLLGLSLPLCWSLSNVPAASIFKQQSFDIKTLLGKKLLVVMATSLFLLLVLYNRNILLSGVLVVVLGLLLAVSFWPIQKLLQTLSERLLDANNTSLSWRLAAMNIHRQLKLSSLQISFMAISLCLLVVLVCAKNQLFDQWQAQLPEQTPNHFVLNILPSQLQGVEDWLLEHDLKQANLYPMVRGRLVAVNEKPVRERVSKEDFSRSGADRELNLSYSEVLPDANTLKDGDWWPEPQTKKHWVSVEQQLADKLKIQKGDVLTFQINTEEFDATVRNIRTVDWDSMKPNFYMLFEKHSLQGFDANYMTSFYLAPEQKLLSRELLKQWPSLVLIDLQQLIGKIRGIVGQASQALQWVLLFALAASVLLMQVMIQSTMAKRVKENRLLAALGASSGKLWRALSLEFAATALLAGVIASALAQCLLWLLQIWVFDLPMQLHIRLWLVAPILALLLLLPSAYFTARQAKSSNLAALLKAE